jgi:hypothetical protein
VASEEKHRRIFKAPSGKFGLFMASPKPRDLWCSGLHSNNDIVVLVKFKYREVC